MILKFYVPHRQKGEKIILLIRRHWFIIFKRLLFWVVLAILPLIFYLFFRQTPEIILSISTYPFLVLFASIYYLYIWLFAFHSFVDYYLDIWLVTNKRVINIEQKGLFYRIISEQELTRIQDVTSEIRGFLPTILNYGDVFIQTAGETPRFIFKQVPDAQHTAKKISALAEQVRQFQKIISES